MKQHKRKHKPGFWHSRLIGIVSVSMVLFLLGLVVIIGLVARELKNYVHESMTISTIMSPNATDRDIKTLEDFLKSSPHIKEVVYISKDQALDEISEELGEDPQKFLGWNPLSPAFELQLTSASLEDRDVVNAFIDSLKKHQLIQRVNYRRDLLDSVNANIRLVSLVMICVAGLLLLVSFTLISNTVRLLIYSRRFLIYTMRLVGATPGFIRRPFVLQNVWNGLLAAVLALGLLGWGVYHLVSVYPVMRMLVTWQNAVLLGVIIVALGVMISVWSAVVTVNKYMRMDMNKLYRI